MEKDQANGQRKKISLSRMGKKIHTGWAGYMGMLFSRLSVKTQKVVFLVAFAASGIYCLTLLFGSGAGGIPDMGRIKHPSIPELTRSNSETERLRAKLEGLKGYLDSLSATKEGIRKGDSILLRNPGLLDSIVRWENQLQNLSNP